MLSSAYTPSSTFPALLVQSERSKRLPIFPFSVNRDTGELLATGELDREERDLYKFKVVARDAFDPFALFTTADVIVKVLDVNDNRPIWETPVVPLKVVEGVLGAGEGGLTGR